MSATTLFLLPDLGGGGAQRVMLTLAEHLDPGKFSPRLLLVGADTTLMSAIPETFPVDRLDAARLRNGLPTLIKRIRTLQPSIVISTLAYTNLALLAIKPLLPPATRIVVREANTPEATLASLPSYVPGKWLYRRLYPRAARVIAQTDAIATTLVAIAPRIHANLSILPNPVDGVRLRRQAAVPKRIPGPGLRLIGAGRLTDQKGFDRLVEIVAKLPSDTRVTIYGDGPDRAALLARIEALDLASQVELAGFTPDLPAHLAGADGLIMPSRWEGLPNVALESLAVGTPVLASSGAALSNLARQAPNAVIIANADHDFIAHLKSWPVAAAPFASPRASLLPDDYAVDTIVRQLETILTEVLA